MLTNLSRLHAHMQRENLDAVIGTCPESVTYLSGFWAMSQWVRRGPQAYVLQPKPGEEACIVTNSGLLDLVPDQEIWVKDIRRYGFFQIDLDKSAQLDAADRLQKALFDQTTYKGPVEALVAAIKERGLANGRFGIDELGITPQCMEQL
ncbi:MAG: aminopeptidase P family N-terminal domain-containing protein, partial [Xanthobacteraceae bacterium]